MIDCLRAVIYAVFNLGHQDPSLGIELPPVTVRQTDLAFCELREHDQVPETTNPTFGFKYSRLVPPR